MGSMFQSAPHFSSEANLVFVWVNSIRHEISIRASLQQRGEPGLLRSNPQIRYGFNPRLTSAARRTANQLGSPCVIECFNPRLTSAARRTLREAARKAEHLSFNPSLTSAARRTRGASSSRPPRRPNRKFQSAPHFSSEANREH